jgi:hypothetical protein
MQTIRFNKTGANSAFGAFQPGDILRCSDAMAAHLIDVAQVADVAKVAEAVEVADVVEPAEVAEAHVKTVKRKKK